MNKPIIHTTTCDLSLERADFKVSFDYELIPSEPSNFYQPYQPEDVEIKSFDILSWNGKSITKIKNRKSTLFYTLLLNIVESNIEKVKPKLIRDFHKQDEEAYICYLAGERE